MAKEHMIEEMMRDDAFVTQIENAKDLTEVAALFRTQGVEVTKEQLEALLTSEEGELDETALDNVAGGGIGKIISQLVKNLLKKSSGNGGKGSFGGGAGGGGFR